MNADVRALLLPALLSGLMFALLVSLGSWQVRRLGEKEALIARVESRVHEPPADAPARGEWAGLKAPDYDFRHVRLTGSYEPAYDALVFDRAPDDFGTEPGYFVLTPFRLSSGGVIIVDRGFLPQSRAKDAARRAPPAGEVAIAGLLRAPQSRNAFTPADDPARNIWYTRDPAAMAAGWGLADVAPFTLTLDATGAVGPDAPRPAPGKPNFPNNHFSYAFTWFSLALADLVIFVLYARGVARRAQ